MPTRMGPDGREQTLYVLGQGEPFCLCSLVDTGEYPAYAAALTQTRVLTFPAASLAEAARQDPEVLFDLLRLMEVLRAKDFSEEKFQEVIKANERILAAPWNRALTRTLRETAALVQEFQDTLFRHKGGVQQLEDVTVGVVESGGDVDRMLGTIRRGFTEMVSMSAADHHGKVSEPGLRRRSVR